MRLFSFSLVKTCVFGAQKNRFIETVLLSTYNICFGLEKIKLIFSYALLSGGLQCRLLITSADSLDPHQSHYNFEPDLDPKVFDTLMEFQKDSFKKKVNCFKTYQHSKLPSFQRVRYKSLPASGKF